MPRSMVPTRSTLTRSAEYAVILLDLMMPIVTGVEFLQAFHEANPNSRTVVFVMTAFDDVTIRHIAPNLVHGIVRKPFDVPQLVAMVREVALTRMPARHRRATSRRCRRDRQTTLPVARAELADLLVAQRVDRIEPRGFARRVEAEEDADERRPRRTTARPRSASRRSAIAGSCSTASDAPTPSATPMTPPTTTSVTASNRNCSRTWRPFAPMAMRMPISRVRSVTDTSMMFMMPMPPTSSEMAAMHEQEHAQDADLLRLRLRDLFLRAHLKSASPFGRDAVALAQQRRRSRSALPAPASAEAAETWSMSIFVLPESRFITVV